MNLVALAINILWFLIGLIIILGIVWLALYVVKMFVPVPIMVERAIWVVVLILILIALLTLIGGGGGSFGHFRFGASQSYATIAANPADATRYL